MGIANSKDRVIVKSWADNWNQEEFLIGGSIQSLTIVDYTNNVLSNLNEIVLK